MYIVDSLDNDIALVKLKETIPFDKTDRVTPVDLIDSTDRVRAESCIAYGWGCRSYGKCISEYLDYS